MTTQTVHIQTYDYGASLTSATLRAIDTDALVATADATGEVTADSGLYAVVFGQINVPSTLITAGTYRLRAIAGGQPINRYATLTGVDAEVVQSRSERFAELPPNGITATVLATNSITAAALASDAVTEIQSGLATQTSVDAIQSDTDNIQTRLPAALEGGRMAAALDAAGLAADAGVEIASAVWDRVLSAANHNIANSAGRRLRTLQDTGNYLGFVWIDTNGANTGSTFPEDGTFLNPVNTLARALTVAAAATQPIKEFAILQGSTITLASTFSGYQFNGENWTLALGGQDVSLSRFNGAAAGVSGIATGTNPFFYECSIGSVTLPPSAFQTCGLSGTLTVGSAGDYYLVDCFSQVAGTAAPVIDMGAAGATSISIRRWSGGLTFNNIASGDVISLDAVSGGTITLNGADGNVQVRGMCNVVDNRTGSPTLGTTNNMDARFDAVDAQLVLAIADTNELQTDWADGGRLDLILDARASQTSVDDLPTNAELTSALGTGTWATAIPWNAAWDAEVQSEVQDAIEVNHLDHLLAADYDPASKPGVATALFNELIGSDAGVSQFTANALELGPSGSGGDATEANQVLILAAIDSLGTDQLTAITVESGVIGNFPETLTIGDSYTENTGQIKIVITDADGDPITEFGSLQLSEADISFTAFRPNDSAVLSGTCEFVDDVTETYVLLTLPSSETLLGKAEYTYEGRLKFFWEGPSSGTSDDEQKTYKTTPFKFIANP